MTSKILVATLAFAAMVGVGMIPKELTYEAPKYETHESLIVEKIEGPTKVALYPELRPICSCESSYEGDAKSEPQQYEIDGSVRRGRVNPSDIGQCQINLDYHEATALRMGIDLYSWNGNAEFANWLYETQGAQPWSWSNKCHHALD